MNKLRRSVAVSFLLASGLLCGAALLGAQASAVLGWSDDVNRRPDGDLKYLAAKVCSDRSEAAAATYEQPASCEVCGPEDAVMYDLDLLWEAVTVGALYSGYSDPSLEHLAVRVRLLAVLGPGSLESARIVQEIDAVAPRPGRRLREGSKAHRLLLEFIQGCRSSLWSRYRAADEQAGRR